jgi:hypothetical protein
MYNYNEIRNTIKANPICFVYKVNPKKEFELIIKSNKKSDAKKQLKKKYKETDDSFYLIIKLSFHKGTGFLQGGPLKAAVSVYKFKDGKLSNQGNNKVYSSMGGPVWFGKEFLEKYNWNAKYLDTIIKKVINGKVKLCLIANTSYEVYFK